MRLLARLLFVAAAVLSLAAAPTPSRADEVDDDIKTMKDAEKAGGEEQCLAAMDKLRQGRDAKAFVALRELAMTSKNDKVACAAIRWHTVTWHDAEFFRWLTARVEDKTWYAADGRPEVYKCILESIREYPPERVKGALKQLGDAVNRNLTTEPEYADRAIRAYGTVPDRFTVMQLLAWLDQMKPGSAKDKDKAAKESARKAILETLATLTGQQHADLAAWKKWWDENGKKFKFPEVARPDDPGAAPKPPADIADPSKLTEFKDEVFGYTVKKPADEWWRFFKPDMSGPRVGLECLQYGSTTANNARAYVWVFDPTRAESKDVKSFADWVIGRVFKEQLDTETMPEQPTAKQMTIDGVTWTVVQGRGLALGTMSGWGTIERRYYVTNLDANILYVDAYVRLSADKEDKDALWATVEGIVLPAKK